MGHYGNNHPPGGYANAPIGYGPYPNMHPGYYYGHYRRVDEFVIIVVLFILLIIVGATCAGYDD